jgi:hypothetical protein
MRFLRDSGIHPPKALYAASEVVLNASLRRAFENEEISPELIDPLLEESRSQGISLDEETLEYALRRSLERIVERLAANPTELQPLEQLNGATDILRSLPFQVNLWKVQNVFYELLQSVYPEFKTKEERGDEKASTWIRSFTALGEKLSVRVDSMV